MGQCVRCGDNFIESRSDKIYCSPECCKQAWYLRSVGREELIERTSNGAWIAGGGYLMVEDDNGKLIYYHRQVMEEKLGRKLLSTESVHHIDEDKLNNDPDNLEVYSSHAEHMKQHRRSA
jgi:hypothetical protein